MCKLLCGKVQLTDIERIDYASWLSREPGLSCLKMTYALTGDSTVEVLNRVAHLFRLDQKGKNIIQADINTTLKRRDQYQLAELLFGKKVPVMVAKGSSRFSEGKMKANLVYTELAFEVEDEGSKEILTLPFLYERYTRLLFSQMVTENITLKLRLNFIKKVINELQCERISPWQKKYQLALYPCLKKSLSIIEMRI